MSSSSKELSKFEKEKQKLVQEKCQGLLNEMLRDEDNKYCVDCDAKGPRWASWNLGIFLCIRCAGIHRNLGVHISRVKSVNLDSWTPEQVVTMQQMGNSRARAVYEANLPDNFRRPQTDVALENFIRGKYEHKKYIAQEWVKPAPPRVDWNAEIEEQIRKKKEKKHEVVSTNTSLKLTSKIGSTVKTVVPTAPPTKLPGKVEIPVASSATVPVVSNTNASDDLLGLNVGGGGGEPFTDPFASPVKSTNNTDLTVTSDNDLGSVCFNSTGVTATANDGKMSKESILSLYGSLNTNNTGFNPGIPGGGGVATAAAAAVPGIPGSNPFMGGFPSGVPPPTNNPFPWNDPATFNPATQQSVAQLQQNMFGLNLGGVTFNNPNGGVLSGGVPPQPFGNAQMSGAQLNMLQQQQQPQQVPQLLAHQIPPVFNQFQSATNSTQGSSGVSYGMFQNGGTPNTNNTPNVDLLWK